MSDNTPVCNGKCEFRFASMRTDPWKIDPDCPLHGPPAEDALRADALAKALDVVYDAWVDSDVHPRHGYGECTQCDEVSNTASSLLAQQKAAGGAEDASEQECTQCGSTLLDAVGEIVHLKRTCTTDVLPAPAPATEEPLPPSPFQCYEDYAHPAHDWLNRGQTLHCNGVMPQPAPAGEARTPEEMWQARGKRVSHKVRGLTLTVDNPVDARWLAEHLNAIDALRDSNHTLTEALRQAEAERSMLRDYGDQKLPPGFGQRIDKWLAANHRDGAQVRWGGFPLGMVRTWIDRAEAAEAKIRTAETEVTLANEALSRQGGHNPDDGAVPLSL